RTLASGSLVRLEQRPDHVSVVVGDGRRVARTHNRNVGAGVVGAARVAPVQNQRVNRTANRVPKVPLDNVKHVRGVGERSLAGHHNNGGNLSGAQRRAPTGEIRSRLLGGLSSKTNLHAAIVNRDNLAAQGEGLRGDNLGHERLRQSASQQGARVHRLDVHREGVKSNGHYTYSPD